MAWFGAAKSLTRVLPAILLLTAPALAQRSQSPFTVANVTAEAEAADSVEAKRLATQSAEVRAFRTLLSRLTDFRAGPRVPDLPAEEVERLVSDIEIRGEGVTGTSYAATFGVTFSERAANALFTRYGVVPILDRGPEILIVPVYIEDGNARLGDRNPWRSALIELDLTHALVPAKVAPARSDLTAAIANSYATNASAGVETLKTQYHTPYVLFAVASTSGGSNVLTLKLAGFDALGLFSLQRKVKAEDAADEPLLRPAARLAFETVQERWKLTRDSFVQAAEPGATPAADSGVYATGEVSSILITAEFSGLKEWQTIRARLQHLSGLQNWDLKSVNPRSAIVSFDFPGGAGRLTAMAAAQGLAVENGAEGLIVKTR
ncbi:MAG: hypothetical protein ACLPX9_04565 [Rhodomicrobium sp.]